MWSKTMKLHLIFPMQVQEIFKNSKGSLISEGILTLIPLPKKGAKSRP